MTDAATKEADLAAIKTRIELFCAIANQPKFSNNPVVAAALANAKASYAAFLAAVAEADAAHGFKIWSTYRHVRQVSKSTDSALELLGMAIEEADGQHDRSQASGGAASHRPTDSELRDLALKGRAADAVFGAFVREEQALNAPEHDDHFAQTFKNESSQNIARAGYRIRLAEELIRGPRLLAARGQVDEILRSDTSDPEKTKAILDYFENHDIVGLGEPIRPYVLVQFDEVREVCQRFIDMLFEMNGLPNNDHDAELYHRLVAYGYAYKVAEELVRGHSNSAESLSSDDTTASSGGQAVHDPRGEYFRDKPNTKAILQEKANMLAHLIFDHSDWGLLLAGALKSRYDLSNIRLGDEEARQSLEETVALLLSLSHRAAFNTLGSEDCEFLITSLEAAVISALQDKGVERRAFQELLCERYKEFSGLDAKDIFRAFGKKEAAIFGIGPDIVFDAFLAHGLLKNFVCWNLKALFADGVVSPSETSSVATATS